jgi:hypothetical protein
VAFTVAAIQYCLFTLALERRVVWHAPRSFAKYAFLISKYMPILDGVLVFVSWSGFVGAELTTAVSGRCAPGTDGSRRLRLPGLPLDDRHVYAVDDAGAGAEQLSCGVARRQALGLFPRASCTKSPACYA